MEKNNNLSLEILDEKALVSINDKNTHFGIISTFSTVLRRARVMLLQVTASRNSPIQMSSAWCFPTEISRDVWVDQKVSTGDFTFLRDRNR